MSLILFLLSFAILFKSLPLILIFLLHKQNKQDIKHIRKLSVIIWQWRFRLVCSFPVNAGWEGSISVMLWCNLTHCCNNEALLQYGSVRRCLCLVYFQSAATSLSCRCIFFPYISYRKHLRRLTVNDAFLVVPTDECCHLISTGSVYIFPGNDLQNSSTVNHWHRGYILSFSCHFQLLVVECLCWQCMVAPAEWKKKALGNSTIFAQFTPTHTPQ